MSHVFLVRRKFLTIHQACLQYHKHGIYAYKHGMCAHKFLDISGCCTLFSSSTVIRSMYKSITSDYMRGFFFSFLFFFFSFGRGSGCGVFLFFVLVFLGGVSLQTLLESQYQDGFLQDSRMPNEITKQKKHSELGIGLSILDWTYAN